MTPFQKLVGYLMYLTSTTKSDIFHGSGYLSRVLPQVTEALCVVVKRVLIYLKETRLWGLSTRELQTIQSEALVMGYGEAKQPFRKVISGCTYMLSQVELFLN